MITKVSTVVFLGIEAKLVEIQTHLGNGLPCFNIVGLADKSVNESKERIRAAFSSININLPPKRITINLSPSDLQKEGSHFDVPIALCLLMALDIIPKDSLDNFIALGELSLNGDIIPTKGTLAALIASVKNKKGLIFPNKQVNEVGIFSERLPLIPSSNLKELIAHFNNKTNIVMPKISPRKQVLPDGEFLDMADIKGQKTAKRALEVAAAGGHNMLMFGPPGVGKSTLANAIRGILPPLNKKEMLDVSIIYSISGLLGNSNLITNRPFRSPHHTTTDAALIGGGKKINPGEITLASKGVLFLDELAEFNRNTLDSLREPLETGEIHISRANARVKMPCDFQLIAATNPCSCGYFSVPSKECHKAPYCAVNYQSKLSGPLLDRIDLIIELSEPEEYSSNFSKPAKSDSSSIILQKVIKARDIQKERYNSKNFTLNAKMDNASIKETTAIIQSNSAAWSILNRFANTFKISLRSYNKIIKLSRTISDLENNPNINEYHVSEAISYRKTNCTNGYLK